MENLELCWTCQGQGFLEKTTEKKICWNCKGTGTTTLEKNQQAKKRANWLKVLTSLLDQLKHPVDEDGYNVVYLTNKEIFTCKYIVQQYLDQFFDGTGLSEILKKINNKYQNFRKTLIRKENEKK